MTLNFIFNTQIVYYSETEKFSYSSAYSGTYLQCGYAFYMWCILNNLLKFILGEIHGTLFGLSDKNAYKVLSHTFGKYYY